MNVYLAATDVSLTIPLVDQDGNGFDVQSIQYRVKDALDAELVPLTLLAGFTPSAAEAVVVVPAAFNGLSSGLTQDLRTVELLCVTDGSTVVLQSSYVVNGGSPLVVGLNSFQLLPAAELLSSTMTGLPGWTAATPDQRIAGMMEAYRHICQLNFQPVLAGNQLWGQDSLNFIPEGSFPTNYVSQGGAYVWGGNMLFVTPAQYPKLPQMMRQALSLAQVAEADFVLGGDPIEQKRRAGVTIDNIGESKQMFRTGRPLELPVCRRAASYLGMFITMNKRLARG